MSTTTNNRRKSVAFRLDLHSGVPVYRQIIDQVLGWMATGAVQPGDQLPTVRQVAVDLAINPNTVLKAYGHLEREGLVTSRPGLGTFITQGVEAQLEPAVQRQLRRGLDAWLGRAAGAGLDREGVLALVSLALEESQGARVA